MKNSTIQEKLRSAIEFGSEYAALHEGEVCLNRCFGITGFLSQPEPEPAMICAGKKLSLMSIEEIISMLEKEKTSRGDNEIYGILQPEPIILEEAKEIKTVCTITYKGNDGEDKKLTLLSLNDLGNKADE